MSTSSYRVALLAFAAVIGGCGASQPESGSLREAWNPTNDPLRLSGEYKRLFGELPLEGKLDKVPWADSYWPTRNAGLSYRWKMPGVDQFSYAFPTKDQVAAMSASDKARLSPAEKYDIYLDRYDYPLASYERRRTNPNAAGWEGLCHGWAAAAIHFEEPRAVMMTSPSGVQVPFGTSDIKALLTFYQGNISGARTKALGARCDDDIAANPNAGSTPQCRDTNAGAFHVVLANQLGLMKQSVIADVTRDLQVWNQPIHAFSARVVREQGPSGGAAPGTVKEVVISASMTFTVEVAPRWESLLGTGGHADSTRSYLYRVELNGAGEIIGGEWLDAERPDFLWMQEKPLFAGYFERLKKIYEMSLTAEALPDPTL